MLLAWGGAQANAELVLPEALKIQPVLDMTYAIFHSEKNYNDPAAQHAVSWQEAYAKYGLQAEYHGQDSLWSANIIGISSATFGDGDAGGFTTGKERKTSIEEWRLGWKNTAKNQTDIEISLGRQKVVVGDGFIVAGDALNLGKALADGEVDRGGGYYLAARQSFDFTTVINLKLTENLDTHWYYLKSNNKAQYQPTLWSTDWQYRYKNSNFGLTYLQILDLKDPLEKSIRNHLKDISFRAKTELNQQLTLTGEYVIQKQQDRNENAWYLAANYTFDQFKYKPTLGYRYSSFSTHYDPLFYGNTDAGFGTWFQGEVAGNYAGPMSTNAHIQQISLQSSIKENLSLGILAYQFNTINKQSQNLDGHELDIFAIWSPYQGLSLIPLIGFYKPKHDINHDGTQSPDRQMNTYTQLIVQYVY